MAGWPSDWPDVKPPIRSTSSLFSSAATRRRRRSSPPPRRMPKGAQFAIAPVIGPPENVASELRTQLDRRHGDARASASPRRRTRRRNTRCAATSSPRWRRRAPSQGVLHLGRDRRERQRRSPRQRRRESCHSGKSKDPWTAVTPALVQSIAIKTVTSVTPGCRRRRRHAGSRQRRHLRRPGADARPRHRRRRRLGTVEADVTGSTGRRRREGASCRPSPARPATAARRCARAAA